MTAIHIFIHLDSEMLNLPELRPLIGKDVEITVTEETARASDSEVNGLSECGDTLLEEDKILLAELDAELDGSCTPPVVRPPVGTRDERLKRLMEIGPIDFDENAIRELRRANTLCS